MSERKGHPQQTLDRIGWIRYQTIGLDPTLNTITNNNNNTSSTTSPTKSPSQDGLLSVPPLKKSSLMELTKIETSETMDEETSSDATTGSVDLSTPSSFSLENNSNISNGNTNVMDQPDTTTTKPTTTTTCSNNNNNTIIDDEQTTWQTHLDPWSSHIERPDNTPNHNVVPKAKQRQGKGKQEEEVIDDHHSAESYDDDSYYWHQHHHHHDEENTTIRFANAQIREYSICMGDNPGCTEGIPVSIEGEHTREHTAELHDHWEEPRRRLSELHLTSSKRVRMLKEAGYTSEQIHSMIQSVDIDRSHRESTIKGLKFSRSEECMEYLKRAILNATIRRAAKQQERAYLQRSFAMNKSNVIHEDSILKYSISSRNKTSTQRSMPYTATNTSPSVLKTTVSPTRKSRQETFHADAIKDSILLDRDCEMVDDDETQQQSNAIGKQQQQQQQESCSRGGGGGGGISCASSGVNMAGQVIQTSSLTLLGTTSSDSDNDDDSVFIQGFTIIER
eukprot:scaffold4266_cov83-Cylindrotheca_fusiformis.AAC.8